MAKKEKKAEYDFIDEKKKEIDRLIEKNRRLPLLF